MRYFRKVIQIKAIHSPNVRYGLAQVAAGIVPDDTVLVPGVLTYFQYLHRLATWDTVRQCIGLHAEFWKGADLLLFPPDWLNRAAKQFFVDKCREHPTEAIGIDPAHGRDKTAMAAVNRWGVKELVARKTPDTSMILGEAIAFARKHGILGAKDHNGKYAGGERIVWDAGGGGKERSDDMRTMGIESRTVAFGSSPSIELRRGMHLIEDRIDIVEERYAYVNQRAEMYHTLSLMMDPQFDDVEVANRRAGILKGVTGFSIPDDEKELRRQLAPMPKLTDGEGRYWMLPKDKKNKALDSKESQKTLTELIGCSPDEADAVVLGVHGMLTVAKKHVAGGF